MDPLARATKICSWALSPRMSTDEPQPDAARQFAHRSLLGLSVRPYNLVLAVVLMLGAATMLLGDDDASPVNQKVLGSNQDSIGAYMVALSLFGFIFLNADRGDGLQALVERNRFPLGVVTLLSGFLLALTFMWTHPSLEGVGVLGIIVFLTTLITGRILDAEGGLKAQHVRSAIAVSCVATFYAILAMPPTAGPSADSLAFQVLENFWLILITVIGFYFGGVSVETIVGLKNRRASEGS